MLNDDRDRRMLDSLLEQYGEIQRQLIAVEIEQRYVKDHIERVEEALDKLNVRVEKEFRDLNKKVDAQVSATKWTPSQWVLIACSAIAGLSSVIGIVLTRAPG